jgi:hypothetical protein
VQNIHEVEERMRDIHGLVVGVHEHQEHVPAPPVAAERGWEARARRKAVWRGGREDPPEGNRPEEDGAGRRDHPDPRHVQSRLSPAGESLHTRGKLESKIYLM